MIISVKKQIFIVCTSLNLGGAELQAIWLANSLQNKNYRVSLVVLKSSFDLKQLLNEEVNLIEYKMYAYKDKNFLILRKCFNFVKAVKLFRKLTKKNNTVVFSFLFHSNIFGFLTTIFTKSYHNICIRNDRFSSRKQTKNIKYRQFLIKIISYFANSIIFNSKKAREIYNYYFSNKPQKEIIFNTVLDFEDQVEPSTVKILSEFIQGEVNTFVSIGRLERLKNYDCAIESFYMLKKNGISFKYVIIGGGYLENDLKRLVNKYNLQNNILFMGKILNAKKYLYLFKFFLLPSIHEGFPNSLIESMKEGLIPFATNAGDSHYLIDSGRGIKIKKPSSDSIYESIAFAIDTLTDKQLQVMRENNSNFIKHNLDEDVILKKWIDIIERNK